VFQLHGLELSTCTLGVVVMAIMRRSIIAAAFALALVALWAAIVPLSTRQVSTGSSPAMAKALSLCRTQQGIDQTCAAALTQALVIEQRKHDTTTAADRACHADPRTFPQNQELVHERSPALE
jgi:hypothetical protein